MVRAREFAAALTASTLSARRASLWTHGRPDGFYRVLGCNIYRVPGWLGVRRGGHYIYVRDVNRHRLLFSERNRHGTRRLAALGSWELWMRG